MDITDIIRREEWSIRPAKSTKMIALPSQELWLHHSADRALGAAGVRAIQAFHMDRLGWRDIAYSFLIDRITLDIYEGRGAGIEGGHTFRHNSISHGICVMGNFEDIHTPSVALSCRIAELVAFGHSKGWWPNQLSGGHRDTGDSATACPGANLHRMIPEINQAAQGAPVNTDQHCVPIDRLEYIKQSQAILATTNRSDNGEPYYVDADGEPGIIDGDWFWGSARAVDLLKNDRLHLEAELVAARSTVMELMVRVGELEQLLAAGGGSGPKVVAEAEVGRAAVEIVRMINTYGAEFPF